MRPLALVTGASSGIGRALALRLARAGYDLVLVSRDEARLREVAAQAGVPCRLIAQDLAAPDAAARVVERLEGAEVDVLVNNAGFGLHGDFADTELAAEKAMIETQVVAPVALTKLLLPGMKARGRGRILNVGSVYSYGPAPHQAIYGATKAFLLSFSAALRGELVGTGVTVTALLPGLTRTEFHSRAGIGAKGLKGMPADEVAEAGYRAMEAGKAVVITGGLNKVFVLLYRALPLSAYLRLMAVINRLRGLKPR